MSQNQDKDLETTCELLDKLVLRQLHLMEEKMQCELNIEKSIHNGSINLAKSRYIMGQNSISRMRLPTESSPYFAASTFCETIEEDGVKQLRVVENSGENTVNPLRWFGVLVPQNLHKAQSIFQNTINFVVECANVQLQLQYFMNAVDMLYMYKKFLKTKIVETVIVSLSAPILLVYVSIFGLNIEIQKRPVK